MAQMGIFSVLLILGLVLFFMNLMLSEKENSIKDKQIWFECGIENKFSSRSMFSIQFFLICLVFVMFDLEIIFLYNFIFSISVWFYFFFMAQMIMVALYLFGTLVLEWKIGSISWKY